MVAAKYQIVGLAIMAVGAIVFVAQPIMQLESPSQSVASKFSSLVPSDADAVSINDGGEKEAAQAAADAIEAEARAAQVAARAAEIAARDKEEEEIMERERAKAAAEKKRQDADDKARRDAEAAAAAAKKAAKDAEAAAAAAAAAKKAADDAAKKAAKDAEAAAAKKAADDAAKKAAKDAEAAAKKEAEEREAREAEERTAKAGSLPECKYDDICKLEKAKKFEAAFAAYEERMETCGDYGWETIKVLGEGMSGAVRLRMTPCGLVHAAKTPPKGGNSIGSEKMLRDHIYVDCFVLKNLTDVVEAEKCQGCFPRYFYHSEKTGICYNEFIDSIPLTKFLKAQDMDSKEGIANMKTLFHQGIDALEVLLSKEMVHRDLQAQNMLIRQGKTEDDWKLVVMDFCWLDWAGSPRKFSTSGRKLGRFTRAADWQEHGEEDTYAFACAIADVVFMGGKEFKDKDKYRNFCLPNMSTPRTDKASLEYVIWRMTQQRYGDREHDFAHMHRMVDSVKHIRAQ